MSGHAASDVFEDIIQQEAGARRQARKKRSQADRLIDYALESGAERFLDQAGAPHVLVDSEAVSLGTAAYKWLRNVMWDREGISVGGEALKTAAGTLAAFAAREGRVLELHTRSAFREGAVYYRLDKGRVVRIDRYGWRLDANPPVLFRSVPNLKPLPNPEPGGSLDALEDLVNLKTHRDRRLLKAYVATVALPHVARPILQTTGVMGSGKTTAGRVVKRAFDPTAPETVRVDPRDFLQKASHAYIVMLDNQNSLPEWAVDTLCRLVTGEGDSKRSLYTDDEDFVYEMRRAVLLNGINPPTHRGDAQDRTLPVELDRIPDRGRRSEEELWEGFDAGHSRLLGAAFDALAGGIRARESLELSRRPRLADWGEYAAGVYEALGWGAELFLEDWDGVVRVQNQGTLDGSPVAQAILGFMENRDEYTGPASDLHAKLGDQAEELKIDVKRERTWPKTPSWLWRRMREVLPLLVAMGIEANNPGNTNRGSIITLTKAPADGGPEGSSKNMDATPDATPEKAAEESASESRSSRSSNYGHSSPSLSRTREGSGGKQGGNGDRGRELPADATPATPATPVPSEGPSGGSVRFDNGSVGSIEPDAEPPSDKDLEGLQDLFEEEGSSGGGEAVPALTVEEVGAEMCRRGSGPEKALATYLETPSAERLGWLVGAVLRVRGLDIDEWERYAAVVEEAAGDRDNHRLECDCERCL